MNITKAYEDIAYEIAKLSPQSILDIKANDEMNKRVQDLIAKKKNTSISIEESAELERWMALDMLINMAKAKTLVS